MDQEFQTPILFVIFNRPDVTKKVFSQIKLLKPKNLFIAADGPRKNNTSDYTLCEKTREIINEIDWDCNLNTLFRQENLGCGLAVSSAITWFFEKVDQGIILEDDCLPSLDFFKFCGELLHKYREDEDVYVISGMNRLNNIKKNEGSYYFTYYPITWGWASWRRAWNKFNYNPNNIEEAFKSNAFSHVFQTNGEKRYWKRKMSLINTEKKNIWDYQWRFSFWLNKGIGITPYSNLVINIGTVDSPTHTFLKDSFREPSTYNKIDFPLTHPPKKIERNFDRVIFNNAYSHSINRFARLIKENGIVSITRYFFRKLI